MNFMPSASGVSPTVSVAPTLAAHQTATGCIDAAFLLVPSMEAGTPIDATVLRTVMTEVFRGSDADGAWDWKTAYDVCEVASLLFLRQYRTSLGRFFPTPVALLPSLQRAASLLPTHTKRSEDSQTYQQFSTPMPRGCVTATAAGITAGDIVLEPSAGTGFLAVLAEGLGGRLLINELEPRRAELIESLFPEADQSRHDAARIDDYLNPGLIPSVVLINPPFSVVKGGSGTVRSAAMMHLRRIRVMGSNRIELSGFDDSQTERLKAMALFHEIINWKLRFFVPVSIDGVAILGSVLKSWPIERVTEKEGL